MNIRDLFLRYFQDHDHLLVKSSPVIPSNDSSILFTNSGMVQFKRAFLALENAPSKNVTTCQKCVRAGGKHNDLDNVGHTNRHHTFFEMLGNFSFGGYFKKNAIALAWKFLTHCLYLDESKLWITIHPSDFEAREIWMQFVKSERIIEIEDNFWSMGSTGPCGYCSEIYYDKGHQYEGNLPGQGDEKDRYVEIWNIVFMSFNRDEDGKMTELEQKCIDTGMGLERVMAILESKESAYETTIFMPIIQKIQMLSGKLYSDFKSQFRIIADHLRSCAFMMSDGITPSNEGRGYVLRRIMRRAFLNINKLDYKKCMLTELYDVFLDSIGNVYSELSINREMILMNIQIEYEKFLNILTNAEAEINRYMRSDVSNKNLAEYAFFLYETHGIPFDITKSLLSCYGCEVFESDFDIYYSLHQEKAKESWHEKRDSSENFMNEFVYKMPATDFCGYDNLSTKAKLLKYALHDNKLFMVFDKTCFYATGGGQIGDCGEIVFNNFEVHVLNTEKLNGVYVHICEFKFLSFDSAEAILRVNELNRKAVSANHSATHLLNSALRRVLGPHVVQKGSLVDAKKFRFDFSHNKSLLEDEIVQIENIVNEEIQKNSLRYKSIMAPEEAIKNGAIGTFEDKYEKSVFVVSIGNSTEICGGTHVDRSGEIGVFKIVSQSSVASGVRRIEAITGMEAVKCFQRCNNQIQTLSLMLNTQSENALERIKLLVEESKKRNIICVEFERFHLNSFDVHAFCEKNIDSMVMKEILTKKIKSVKRAMLIGVSMSKHGVCMVLITKDLVQESHIFDAKKILERMKITGGGSEFFAQGPWNGMTINDYIAELTEMVK
ncbi:alanine--tRNA ligase [Candidatus Gromoviella agglomerans]|uniref:alanine--tRNA ligase n=1 Tax=Candidatus Gromoviella agglomerans TaxID=2806609 RepID=UPI002367BAD0|nr:alanine--tRNA ligase [Candidatus Gromoviella agglomerans]UFX98502.1 Alanine--tRNA ligase [Candidatus Gromoviella agglomerans]